MKRVLHKIKIDEVSAVDRPAQSGALMTIMKRDDGPDLSRDIGQALIGLEDRILILRDAIDVANLRYDPAPPSRLRKQEPTMDLEHHAREIRKRDGCSNVEALRRARQENPAAYQDYTAEPIAKSAHDFDALVAEEIRKGAPPNAAAQRVVQKWGIAPPRDR